MLTVALGMMLCLPLRLINYRDCDGLSWLMIVNSPNHHVSEGYSEELVRNVALCGFMACAFRLRKNCLTFVKLLECVLCILFFNCGCRTLISPAQLDMTTSSST